MVAVANKQQFKIKVYKKQIEEAGDIIAFILAKFREAEQELEEANKQQFRKERDNKGGTRRSMAIFALNTLTNWQQLRETVGNVSAEGIRPFLYWEALVCDRQMSLFICLSQAGVSRVACWSRGPLTFFVYHRSDKKPLVISA